MRILVTALVVAETGEWLDTTLAALRAQTYPADRVVGVINGQNNHELAEKFATGGAEQVVVIGKKVPFGQAIAQAEKSLATASGAHHYGEIDASWGSKKSLVAGEAGSVAADGSGETIETSSTTDIAAAPAEHHKTGTAAGTATGAET
ncbi:MAG: hypothetical protein Q4C71_03690, partial [Microbacteriaceae bacterium]|nr:hypothetical protein [Microbacteriaceae bacterium]